MVVDTTKRQALVIDDCEEDRNRVRDILAECGFNVVTAQNTVEARTRLKFQVFDLLVTDVVMPKENGIQFLISLHESASAGIQKELPPVILMSAMSLNDQLRTKLTKYLGVRLILPKPVDAKAIVNFVSSSFEGGKEKGHIYDVSMINKFLSATNEIITLNSQTAPVPGKAFVKSDGHALGEFTGIIELRSMTQHGFIALSFERPCCELMARKILQDNELVLNDAILRDIAGEMCNQVVGHVQAQFQREGTRFEVSTPTIVSGQKYRIDHRLQAPSIVIPFVWNDVRFYTQFVMVAKEGGKEAEKGKTEKEKETLDRGDITFL
jgi:chemotaxis protein CheX